MTDTDIKLPEPANPEGSMPCEDCGGTGVFGEPYGGSEFQPPGYDSCESCGGSGKWNLPMFTGGQMRAAILADRAERAPAVPNSVTRETVVEWLDALDIEVSEKQLSGLFHAAAPSSAAEPSDLWERFMAHLNKMHPLNHLTKEGHKNFLGSADHYRRLFLEANAASQPAPSAPPQGEAIEVEQAIDAYLEDYVFEGDDCCYTPNSFQKLTIKDAIMGLLADDDFRAAFPPPQGEAPHPFPAEFPHYELRFIMRVLSHEGGAPREDWQTAYGMARAIFEAWHAHSVQQGAASPPSTGGTTP